VPLDEGNGGGTCGTSLRLHPDAGGQWSAAHERPQAGERWLGQRKGTTLKVGWVGVGHVGRVMLTGLAQNRKKKNKKGS
jgi:hypothetical protein